MKSIIFAFILTTLGMAAFAVAQEITHASLNDMKYKCVINIKNHSYNDYSMGGLLFIAYSPKEAVVKAIQYAQAGKTNTQIDAILDARCESAPKDIPLSKFQM